jgi:hypothetical protein
MNFEGMAALAFWALIFSFRNDFAVRIIAISLFAAALSLAAVAM